MYRHKGFTLIELITVIAILGALAVIALPRFINLQDEAEQAAVEGVAGSLAAGSAVNLAAVLAGNTADAQVVTTCGDVGATLSGGSLPADYTFPSGAAAGQAGASLGGSNGATADCTVEKTVSGSTYSATFQGYFASF